MADEVVKESGRLHDNKDVEGFLQTLYAFVGLSPCAVAIASRQYGNNEDVFHTDQKWRQKFPYTDSRVKQGLKELLEKGFVRKGKVRGYYQLNPNLFLRGDFKEIRIRFTGGQMLIDYDTQH